MPVASRVRLDIRLLAVVAVAGLSACGSSQQQGGGFHGFPPADVTLLTVEPKSIPVTFEYVGQALGSKEVEVRARVGGILEKRLFKEGAPVKSGQTLFIIDPKPYEAQVASAEAEVARAQAQQAQALREAARLKPLVEKKAVGQKEYDDAVSTSELAAASVKAAEANLRTARLNLGYTRVAAPITGLSSRATKSEGSLVTVGSDSLLTTISQTDPMWVQFNVAENDKLRIERAIAEKRLLWPKDSAMDVVVKLADGSTLPHKGHINFEDTRISPQTGTYETRAEIANADNALRSGQFVRVILNGPTRLNAIAVPQAAVLDGPQGKFVYVAGKDKDGKDVALPKPVKLGEWVTGGGANLWIVESGLNAGDHVIVDGIARIQMPGQPIKLAATASAPAGGAITNAPSGAPAQPAAKEPTPQGPTSSAPPEGAGKAPSEPSKK
ncbi:MAG TPA: efflux RND transporter periplasmic adaptor subunit [Casimicrobiaceae bacterium]|jgi:membrane fusion protein (multidrug efflux system)